MKALYTIKIFIAGFAVLFSSCSPNQIAQNGEYDDMYFSSADRDALANATASTDNNAAAYENRQQALEAEDYDPRTTNPEYIANQNQETDAEYEDTYYTEDYGNQGRYDDVRISNYYGRGYSSFNSFHDPFYSPYNSFYDPFYSPYYNPYFNSGFSISFGMGWGSGFGYGYNRYRDPFMRGYYDPWGYGRYYNGYHHGFYDGFYSGRYGYYYNPVIIVDNKEYLNNRRVVYGPRNSSRSAIGVDSRRASRTSRDVNVSEANGRNTNSRSSRTRTVNENRTYYEKSDANTSNRESRTTNRTRRSNNTVERNNNTVTPQNNTRQRSNNSYTPSRSQRSNRTVTPSRSDNNSNNSNNSYNRSSSPSRSTYTPSSSPSRSSGSYSSPSRSSSGSSGRSRTR